jgi:hypothetical protein
MTTAPTILTVAVTARPVTQPMAALSVHTTAEPEPVLEDNGLLVVPVVVAVLVNQMKQHVKPIHTTMDVQVPTIRMHVPEPMPQATAQEPMALRVAEPQVAAVLTTRQIAITNSAVPGKPPLH